MTYLLVAIGNLGTAVLSATVVGEPDALDGLALAGELDQGAIRHRAELAGNASEGDLELASPQNRVVSLHEMRVVNPDLDLTLAGLAVDQVDPTGTLGAGENDEGRCARCVCVCHAPCRMHGSFQQYPSQ